MEKIGSFIKSYFERFIERKRLELGEENIERLISLGEKIEDEQKAIRKNEGRFRWIVWILVAANIVSLTYWFEFEGFLTGVLSSIALIIFVKSLRLIYCEIAIHPGPLYKFDKAKEHVRKYNSGGPVFNKVTRSYWMRKWYYFLYSADGERWSWRPYVLILSLIVLLFLYPLVGMSCVSIWLAGVISAVIRYSAPLALFLGGSTPTTNYTLKKIIGCSGIRWVSLLKDGVSLPEDGSLHTIEKSLDAMELVWTSNKWSLRCDDNTDWRTVVCDFMYASSVIVVKTDDGAAVKEEIEFLATLPHLDRVIVIKTNDNCEYELPLPLREYLMDEDEAIDLISLIPSNPKKFKKIMKERTEKTV